ncbi:unnamed protein product [Pieris brassicae]|uniref:Protein NATD1 n=1 Tax=Pieris brassicae TaxID=7116 RepID=A0A9P0TP28_PIEBR|nr:unnamed protein product [Pieris brassicae]
MLTRARAFSTQALKVVNNVARQQFVITLRTEAILSYEEKGKVITLIHTDVPAEFQGKGVGKLLGQHAFDYALRQKLDVICKCHFLAKFYQDNIKNYKSLNVKLDLD